MDKTKQEIINILKKVTKLKEINLEIPPDSSLGDYAFPCFKLSAKLKKNPVEIAKDLAVKIKPNKTIKEVRIAGPYLNFFVNKQDIAVNVINNILKEKDNFGKSKSKKENIMVEFFHANTHKGVHIGHIRNISIGESLCRILEFNNNKVYRINYFGDIGPHVAKCIWGYLNLKEKEPKEHKGIWLGKIYALTNKKAKTNKKVEKEISEINNKLYARDKNLMEIWKKTKQYCLDDFKEIYKVFGFKFDREYPESECEALGKEVVNNLLKQNIAKKDEGAVIIDLKKDNLGVAVLLTKEGNVLYHAKDLGMVMLKGKEYKVDKSLHVVGSEQDLYMKQIFKIFGLMKHPYANISKHLSYGLVMLPEGKMSSREGTMVLYEDLKQKLFEHAEKEIIKRDNKLNKKEVNQRKEKIALAALKFSMINREFNKNITFDWEKALDFEGETGPYIQYAHARICSILNKNQGKINSNINQEKLNNKEDEKLILLLNQFPEIALKAAESYKPHLIARYLLDLSQGFNEFYHSCPILKADKETKNARLNLILAAKQVLKNGLNLLGINAPEAM